MNGKHNLGFDAIANIPEQTNRPVAVFKSATQKDSAIVLTDMIDANNNPVIIPIHLNKQGRWETITEAASEYGRDDIRRMLSNAKDNGGLIYIDKNRADQVLSGVGLQLSNAKAEADPIFNYNLSNGNSDVNSGVANNVDDSIISTNEVINGVEGVPTIETKAFSFAERTMKTRWPR